MKVRIDGKTLRELKRDGRLQIDKESNECRILDVEAESWTVFRLPVMWLGAANARSDQLTATIDAIPYGLRDCVTEISEFPKGDLVLVLE